MGKRGLLLVAVLLLAGCTRMVDDARPQLQSPVAPIAAGQIEDLLSKKADPNEFRNPYVSVEPAACAALAQEVHAPLIFDAQPAAHSGGYWMDDAAGAHSNVIEIVGIYHDDYDARAAVDQLSRTIESCRGNVLTATAQDHNYDHFTVRPRSNSDSPQIVLWSLTDPGERWACDDAFIAAHNAAIEITTCAKTSGYDVLRLARGALKRIEALADITR